MWVRKYKFRLFTAVSGKPCDGTFTEILGDAKKADDTEKCAVKVPVIMITNDEQLT